MVMKRLLKAQGALEHDALVIEDPIDLFYLTGLQLSLGRLLITKGEVSLFVDGRYYESARAKASCSVFLYPLFQEAVNGKKVAFDASTTTYLAAMELQNMVKELIPLNGPIKMLRRIKEKEEIEKMKEAAHLALRGCQFLAGRLEKGVREKDLSDELEIFWKQNGGERPAFDPIIAFGAASSQPHYRAGSNCLHEKEIVLIDIGVMKESYASDMTRVFLRETLDPKLQDIYKVVDEAKKTAMARCLPGVTLREVDESARKVIGDAGYAEYFPHSLGHGVGLEVHEWPSFKAPFLDAPLEPGMVITIEPGIYLPGRGGVRLEDTLAITETGNIVLTK